MKDIELNENEEFEPIGNDDDPFNGTFDGNGHTISGLLVDKHGEDEVGLFGAVDDHGIVKNLSVMGDVYGEDNVGGVVGWLGNDSEVNSCCFMGNIYGDEAVGGVVGRLGDAGATKHDGNARIISCYHTGSIVGTDDVGGVAGKVFNSNYDGYGKPTIKNCYHAGYIQASGDGGVTGIHVGGLIGFYENPEIKENDGDDDDFDFANSYYDSKNSGVKKAVGGTNGFGEDANSYTNLVQGGMDTFKGVTTEELSVLMDGMVDENGNSLYTAPPTESGQIDGAESSADVNEESESMIPDDAKEAENGGIPEGQ